MSNFDNNDNEYLRRSIDNLTDEIRITRNSSSKSEIGEIPSGIGGAVVMGGIIYLILYVCKTFMLF